MRHLVIPDGRSPHIREYGPLFGFDHLPAELQAVSEPFSVCAQAVIELCPDGGQLQAALQYLLVAKDAAVRSVVSEAQRDALLRSPAQALGYEPSARVQHLAEPAPPTDLLSGPGVPAGPNRFA